MTLDQFTDEIFPNINKIVQDGLNQLGKSIFKFKVPLLDGAHIKVNFFSSQRGVPLKVIDKVRNENSLKFWILRHLVAIL